MSSARLLRTAAIVTSAALVMAAFVAVPAEAKKKKKKKKRAGCAAPAFVEPASPSASRTDAPAEKAVKVTDKATEEAPVVIEFEHGAAFWNTVTQEPIVEDTKWFNVQIDSTAPATGLYLRQEWPIPSVSDMDLYLWDGATGEQAAVSGAFNVTPVNVPIIAETGAMGYESISGVAVADCGAYTIESRAFTTAGEDMTLKIWLGEIQA